MFKSILINIRAAYRFVYFITILCVYFFTAIGLHFLTVNPIKRRKRLVPIAQLYARFMASAFNIKVICKNPISPLENSLVVGNHIGFIDMISLESVSPCIFIKSLEMKYTAVLGRICDLGGFTYVDRKFRMDIQDEVIDISQALQDGFRIALYAESIASNGEQVLPFEKTLLMSAAFANRPIRPFVFNFREVNGGSVLYSHRDSLCWYGDESFIPAFWRSLKLDSVTCEIEFLPLLHVTVEDNRNQIAEYLHQIISEKYVPFRPEMNVSFQTSSDDSTSRTELAPKN